MTKKRQDLKRLKSLFMLGKLSVSLQSDVLADGIIASRCGISVKSPIRLGQAAAVLRDDLFAAFGQASDGVEVSRLLDERGGEIPAKIWIEPDGSGIVEIDEHKWRFVFASLLSGDIKRRLGSMDRFLSKHTLTLNDIKKSHALVGQEGFSNEDFISVVRLLSSSPETFAEGLKSAIETRQIGQSDLLPEDMRHWDHLTAPWKGSPTLATYMETELAEERRGRLAKAGVQGFRSIALTFSAPSLVPHELIRSCDPNTVANMIESSPELDDHFGLIGAFEVCADWALRNARSAPVGKSILDKLFADMERLRMACGIFAATFIIATARLAEHATLRARPVYWRRLAASAHASLVVRTSGVGRGSPEELIAWAIRLSGETYFLSVLRDMAVEPTWCPEWIFPDFLVADVYGRALAAIQRLPEGDLRNEWTRRLEPARQWIVERRIEPLTILPAVLEGGRRVPVQTFTELNLLPEAYRRFADDPSVDGLVSLTAVIESRGFPVEAMGSLLKVIDLLRHSTGGLDDGPTRAAVTLLAHIAVQVNNVSLANAVSDLCLEKSPGTTESQSLFECVCRLVECSGADSDRRAAEQMLSRRLEQLASALEMSEPVSYLVSLLEKMKQVDPELAPMLGRALAVARLGMPRSRAS